MFDLNIDVCTKFLNNIVFEGAPSCYEKIKKEFDAIEKFNKGVSKNEQQGSKTNARKSC